MAKSQTAKKQNMGPPHQSAGDDGMEAENSGLSDRMLRYQGSPACPECRAHPTVCMSRTAQKRFFRCRQCGHRFEGHMMTLGQGEE